MARKKVGLKICSDSVEQNESILRELQAQKKVDDRSPRDLKELFNVLNTNNLSKNAKDDDKFAAFSNTHETTGTYGPIPGCPSGTWWGIRVDCSRQGVHKPFNLDVHDGQFGAISVCTPQSTDSRDVDLGDILTLTGRDYLESESSNESLILNFQRCVPLRLVRSYSLSNFYSPKTGYRYDGLYVVIAHWIGESESLRKHKFALLRILNQEPPHWHNLVTKPVDPKVERAKSLPKKLSCTLRKRSSKLNSQTALSKENDKYNCEKFSKKLNEPPSASQNGIAILTRQVFKKPSAPSTTPPVSRSALSVNSTLRSYMCKEIGQSKLQNTNISVRTDLYDSFHNVQQEVKRSASLAFCKVLKASQLEKSEAVQVETASTKKSLNSDLLTSFTKTRSSDLQKKNTEVEKVVNFVTDYEKATTVKRASPISCESIYQIVGCPISNKMEEVNFLRKNSKLGNRQEKESPEKRTSAANSTSSNSSNSLEALTPDKILNLVVKEKRNPMAKLLIGNVIGLSIEESKVIKAYNALISKENKESEHLELQSDNRLKTASNFKMISKRILRHNRNDDNRKNYSKLSKRNRGCNDTGQITGVNSKFNDDPGGTIGYSKSVKRTKISENSKINKKSSGCKKQRREIANLVIDANVGPLIRGPRNRRLRCQNRKIIGKEPDGFIANSAFQKRRSILNKPAKRSELSKRRKRLKRGINKTRKLQTGNINLNLPRGKRSTLENTRNFQEILTRNSDVQRMNVESVDLLMKKSKMVDAVAQCSLINEPTMNNCLQFNSELDHSSDLLYNNGRLSVIKIEEVYLDEIKSEGVVEFSEEDSVESHEFVNGFESEEAISGPKACERLSDQGLESVYNIYPLIHRESAFVPVNSSSSLKIARLRSIGFRPIQMEDEEDLDDNLSNISDIDENSDSVRKDADEEYNKYANDDTSEVGYMEDDLHFEDIENEDASDVSKRKDIFCNRVNVFSESVEENFERPWHGWKKISSKNGDQWIGW